MAGRPLLGALGAAFLLLILLVPSGNLLTPSGPATSPRAPVIPAVSTYAVSGVVLGLPGSSPTATPIPIDGDTVRAVPGSGCPITEFVPGACAPTTSDVTDSSGAYTLMLPTGDWLVYSLPRAGFGGDTKNITVYAADIADVNLTSYLELSYTNSTFVLPEYTPLTPYVNNSDFNTQVPVVSYSADGVFYIDLESDLVFYSFATQTLESIASWTPLYENVADYAGDLENAFFLTLDGTYAYELGCTLLCAPSSHFEVRAVNISTGQTFVWNVNGLVELSTKTNLGVNLIGLNGNDSTVALLLSSGVVYGYGLWNGTQFILGQLPFFEANNAYWVPFLNAFVSVEANGETTDDLNEAELEPIGAGLRLVDVYTGQITGAAIKSNFVDGLVFNLTLNEFAFAFGSYSKNTLVVATYSFAHDLIRREVGVRISAVAYGDPLADEHRVSVSTGAPIDASDYDPYFYNQSWAVNPFSGQYFDTDAPSGTAEVCAAGQYVGCQNQFTGQNYAQGPVASNVFLNASYGITPYSVNCHPSGVCPLLGTTAGTTLGTIDWLSPSGASEFPYSATAALDQPYAPSPVVVSERNTSTSITVDWAAPANAPVLNYTFFWGPTPGPHWTNATNLSSVTTSFTLGDLTPGTLVCYGVAASNLHGEGTVSTGCANPGELSTFPPVTNLSVTGITAVNATLNWTLPAAETLSALSIFVGGSCGHWDIAQEVDPTVEQYDLTGLTPLTTYCFAVEDEVADGNSALSPSLTFTTGAPGGPADAPSDLEVVARGSGWADVDWTNPNGVITGDRAFVAGYQPGVGCGYPILVSGNDATSFTSWNFTGLARPVTYCVTVIAVALGGASPASAVLFVFALQPSGIRLTTDSDTTISLTWTNIPAATILNATVYVGTPGCAFTDGIGFGSTNNATLVGLRPSTSYCVTVADWVAGSPRSQSETATPFLNVTTPSTSPVTCCSGGGSWSLTSTAGEVG
ncbi:MAG TPA: fibronectin type III domain-containing protein, partial [Thermoplasmata archaeon]|nr:fibronectin type III domain-containing protein [Thermoplasmata archaeon]